MLEKLSEELMELQSTSTSFRQQFKSQQVSTLLINAYSSFVLGFRSNTEESVVKFPVLEKLNHLALALTLDNVMPLTQKQQVRESEGIRCALLRLSYEYLCL